MADVLTFDQWLQGIGHDATWFGSLGLAQQNDIRALYGDTYLRGVTTSVKTQVEKIASTKTISQFPPRGQAARQADTAKSQTVQDELQQASLQEGLSTDPTTLLQAAVQSGTMTQDQANLYMKSNLATNPQAITSIISAAKLAQLKAVEQSHMDPTLLFSQPVMTSRGMGQDAASALKASGEGAKGAAFAIEQNPEIINNQWNSVGNELMRWGNMGAGDINHLQQRLLAAGYYKGNPYMESTTGRTLYQIARPGFFDGETQNALNAAYQDAVRTHQTLDEVLANAASTYQTQMKQIVGQAIAGTQTPFHAPAQKLTDPKEIYDKAQANAVNVLGRALTPDELTAMEQMYKAYDAKNYAGQVTEAKYENTAQNAAEKYKYEVGHAQLLGAAGIKPEAAPDIPGAPTIQTYNPEAEVQYAERAGDPNAAEGQDLRTALSGLLSHFRGF